MVREKSVFLGALTAGTSVAGIGTGSQGCMGADVEDVGAVVGVAVGAAVGEGVVGGGTQGRGSEGGGQVKRVLVEDMNMTKTLLIATHSKTPFDAGIVIGIVGARECQTYPVCGYSTAQRSNEV